MEKLQESINFLTALCYFIILVQIGSCAYLTKDHDIMTAAIWKNGYAISGKCGP